MAGDGDLTRPPQARGDVLAVVALSENLFVLGVAGYHAGKSEDTDGYGGQKPDDQAEYVEEVGILFAHDARFLERTGRFGGGLYPRPSPPVKRADPRRRP